MKKITWILLIGLFFTLTSCSDDNEEHVQIRVKNTGSYKYDNLVVNSNGSGDFNFGTILSNQTSEYKHFQYAYQYAFIKFSIDGTEYKMVPIDYVGEEKLEGGKYTYEVIMDSNKNLTFNFIRD